MRIIERTLVALTIGMVLSGTSGCGMLQNPRTCDLYFKKIVKPTLPDDEAVMLTLWPILFAVHGVGLVGAATVDTVIHAFEIMPVVANDGYDFATAEFAERNMMLNRSARLPQIAAAPIATAGAYVWRMLAPTDLSASLFKVKAGENGRQVDGDSEHSGDSAPEAGTRAGK